MKFSVLLLLLAVFTFYGCVEKDTSSPLGTIPQQPELSSSGSESSRQEKKWTFRLPVGGMGKEIQLDQGRTIDIQITEEEDEDSEGYLWDWVLTIGKFNRLWGSEYSHPDNIYFQSIIDNQGTEVFRIDGDEYTVSWRSKNENSLLGVLGYVMDFTIERQ